MLVATVYAVWTNKVAITLDAPELLRLRPDFQVNTPDIISPLAAREIMGYHKENYY